MHFISKIIILLGLILITLGAPMWAKGVSDKLVGCVDESSSPQMCDSNANKTLKWSQPTAVAGSMIVSLGLIGLLVSCFMHGGSHGRKSPMYF